MAPNRLTYFILTVLASPALSESTPNDNQKLHPRHFAERRDISTDCAGYALNRGTWAELGMDNYLLHYPGGMNMSVADYTRALKVMNFECGIGSTCLSGQLCHPVRGRDWVVLSALQEWNFYTNSMYDAVGSAMSTVQGSAAAMVADFLPEDDAKKILMGLTLGLLGLSSVIMLGFTTALIMPILWRVLVLTWSTIWVSATTTGTGIAAAWTWLTSMGAEETVAAVGTSELAAEGAAAGAGTAVVGEGLASETSEAALQASAQGAAKESALVAETAETEAQVAAQKASAAVPEAEVQGTNAQLTNNLKADIAATGGNARLRKRHSHEATHDKFQMWSTVNAHLSTLQDRLQALLSLTDELTLTSPISSKDGIFGALQNGTFLSDHPPRAVLQNNFAEAAQLGALAQLFKSINMMFVIDSAPCKDEGPTTPLKNPEAVHYCSPEGVKTSLGRVDGKKIDYNVRNGRLIFSKYSYSTKFLVGLATECQAQLSSQAGLTGGPLPVVKSGPALLQNMPNVNTSQTVPMMNATIPTGGLPNNNSTLLNKDPLSSMILLPDGTSVCSFPIPICDLRLPEVKSLISTGKTPAEACREGLKLNI